MAELDGTDELLLQLLAEDSRAPLKVLAQRIGLSVSSTQARIARLKADGEIAAFTIRRPRPRARDVAYFWVTAETPMCERLAPLIAEIPEISICDSIAGEIDMVLFAETADRARLQEIREQIAAMAGVKSVTTANVLKRLIGRGAEMA